MFVRKFIFIFVTMLLTCAWIYTSAFGQSTPQQAPIQLPFSENSINAEIASIESSADISAEEKEQIANLYKAALTKLVDGRESQARAKTLKEQQENAPQLIGNLDHETTDVRKALRRSRDKMMSEYEGKSLQELEQSLVAEQTKLSTFRGLRSQYDVDQQALDSRPAQALVETAALEQAIAERAATLKNQNGENPTPLDNATLALSRASFYADRQKKRALEQEVASIGARRAILDKQISYTAALITQSSDLVSALSARTGSARTDDALLRLDDAKNEAEEFLEDHPLVQQYANENVELADRNYKISLSEGNLPDVERGIGIQLQQVRLDRSVTDQILDSKEVSKAYGEHLRSLRKNQPDIAIIEQAIKAREIDLQDILFQKITNQESLGIFLAGSLDVDALKQVFDIENGESPALTETDIEHLQQAYDSRRGHLSELAAITSLRTRKLGEVNALHKQLLDEVTNLGQLLGSRLLWLPSTETIGLAWPAKVVQGVAQTFTTTNVVAAGRALGSGISNTYFLVFMSLGLLAALYALRERLRPIIANMPSRVSRVQKDAFRLTPLAMLDGIARAAIPTGLLVILGVIFARSGLEINFVKALERTFFVTAVPIFVLLCLRAWSAKGALFDLHFRVDKQLRSRLETYTIPLLPIIGVSVFLVSLTRDGLDFDSGIAALGVFGFILGALGVTWFSFKIAWARSKAFLNKNREAEGFYLRNERWLLALAVFVPIGLAFVAALGYFETALLLMARFFATFCTLLAAYLIHGLLRRFVVIAQRRLALEQARARRDRAVKERMDKAAAEERGEIPVPKLDTASIDLETINRQSQQLVNVVVFVATIVVLWALWGKILPALSVFDEVKLWSYIDASGSAETQKVSITLWNVMQALGIGLITWLAARNLPGFLEMFVLKRFKMAQGSLFAIVTVLGYMIFIIGVLVAFDKLGTQWSQLQWVVAALGVGIGFGLQAIFANFISGLIILFERPIRIGDYITIGGISGTVSRIQIRATTLLDLDNKEILIPNQELISQQVVNWTLENPVTRLIIKVGIAYGSDTEKAHRVMLETIKKNPNVLDHPEPRVLFLGFGDSTLDFELRNFLRDFTQRFIVSHELHMALDVALREADIEIAFPQRDLNIKNPEGLKAILDETVAPQKTKPKPKPKAKPKAKPA